MGNLVIKVENLSKQYRLGQVSTGTLSHDINRWWHIMRGKEDPFLKIGEVNDRTQTGNSDYVWSLQDISFDVNQGDVLGIVGKNGAGKSTLLKILSKVTGPTTGSVKVKGRIASLLEVGTGFHPELTGRENIFLNGAILGMRRHEISRKFDEIVAFSGVEKYIDTPVKRYSSGMYVRLAFAVAAHLEPEILIIDEVLAVGDAEFQKKCLGKMKDVSGEGRTVLFVSHNMVAVKALCSSAILLQNGFLKSRGTVDNIVDQYVRQNMEDLNQTIACNDINKALGNENIRLRKISVSPQNITIKDDIEIDIEFWNITQSETEFMVTYDLINIQEQTVFSTGAPIVVQKNKVGAAKCTIPKDLLNDSIYAIYLFIFTKGMRLLYRQKDILTFEVKDIERDYAYYGKVNGVVRPNLTWSTQQDDNS